MTLANLRDLLLTIGVPVYHYEAQKEKGNYIVWAEDGQSAAGYADNKMTHQAIQGTIDYFTKTEFDPIFNKIQETLNSADIAWQLNSIQYEENTQYIHYEWVWEVLSKIGEDDN